MTNARQFNFDRGDWIAVRDASGEYVLAGKVVAADPDSFTAEYRGVRTNYVPGSDPVVHVRWVGRGQWTFR